MNTPTPHLRWKEQPPNKERNRRHHILQQMVQTADGYEWHSIPSVKEDEPDVIVNKPVARKTK